jgi:hypothetical protein
MSVKRKQQLSIEFNLLTQITISVCVCAPCEQKLRAASKHFLAGAYISRAARDNIISVHTARHIIKHSIAESMCRQAGCAGEPNAICDGMS